MAVASAIWGRGLPPLALCGLFIFTLAYLPMSNDRRFAIMMRPLLTLAFGLVHGFGFASVLTEIGLPRHQLVVALVGFNIGVEIGQVVIVAGVWFLARWVTQIKLIRNTRAWLDTLSAALCGLGFYWFVARSFAQV